MRRQFIVLMSFSALLGCDLGSNTKLLKGGSGAVVADEPRAALVARNVLADGGTAADAAVALYFTLAVSFPTSAGLGGQGVCLVRKAGDSRREKPTTEALDFTAPQSTGNAVPGLTRVGLPTNVRGMFALHARYGVLPWGQVVFPAENLARFGMPVSRALAAELAGAAAKLKGAQLSTRIYNRQDGSPLREGDQLTQFDLAAVLSRVRRKGPGDFYSGELARSIVAGARDVKGHLDIDDLRKFKPQWREAIMGEWKDYNVFFAPKTVAGGVISSRLWKLLYEDGRYRRASAGARVDEVVKTTAEVMGKPNQSAANEQSAQRPRNPAVTGFAVMDEAGGAVACVVTMNGRFGSGKLIQGTGIVAAAAPGGENDGLAVLAPILIASQHTSTAIAAAAPSGDAAAASALISVALRVFRDDETIPVALDKGRAFPGKDGRTIYFERRNGAASPLKQTSGHRLVQVPALGRVNLIVCSKGLPKNPETCTYGADPRGFGYAIDAAR